jgi:hypothetical protein
MRPAVCKKSDPLLFSDFQNYPVRPFPCPAATMAANPIAPPLRISTVYALDAT